MSIDLVEAAFFIGACVCLVSAFVAPWARDCLASRLEIRHPDAWLRLGGEIATHSHWTRQLTSVRPRFTVYILSGLYRANADPAVRRYGAIARYSVLGWFGASAAMVLGMLIATQM